MKQVIVVNQSLAMPVGKLAAQVAHASLAAFLEATGPARQLWLPDGMTKVVLTVPTALDLQALQARATEARIPTGLVRDAGKTVLSPGTITCLGLGPHEADELDGITGDLPLL